MLKSTLVETLIFPFFSELQEPRTASKQAKQAQNEAGRLQKLGLEDMKQGARDSCGSQFASPSFSNVQPCYATLLLSHNS